MTKLSVVTVGMFRNVYLWKRHDRLRFGWSDGWKSGSERPIMRQMAPCHGRLLGPLLANPAEILRDKRAMVWPQTIWISLGCVKVCERSSWKTVKKPRCSCFDRLLARSGNIDFIFSQDFWGCQVHEPSSIIRQKKSKTLVYHHVEGYQDRSTWARVKGGVKNHTNFWTPCSTYRTSLLL